MTREEYDERMAKGAKVGWVYFIEAGPAIKIGWAKNPAARLLQLQTAQAEALDLIGVIPGTRYLESDLHRRLSRSRVRGEWFERNATLKLVRPVIASHGMFLAAGCNESRTIPGIAKSRAPRNRDFVVTIQEFA